MEFIYSNLDEFVLDFDAEEASLQLQAEVLGQMQAFAAAGPGLGAFPVRQAQTLPNNALRAHGRQQPQLGGGAPAAEPVHLDSQLDALRREIARLEQQKQKQSSARSAAAVTAAASNGGVRRAQQQVGANVTGLPRPTGITNAGATAPPGGATQRQLATKRPRIVGPAQSDAAPAGGAAADAPQAAATTGTTAVASQGPREPATSEAAPAFTGHSSAATGAGAAPSGQRVASKRPASGAAGGPAAEQRTQVTKRQPPQRKPQQPQQPLVDAQPPEACEPGPHVGGARQTQLGGGREAEASPQRAPQTETTAQADYLPSAKDNTPGVRGPGRDPALRSAAGRPPGQQQAPGANSAQGSQQSPSHRGPGPPRKRPRALGQQPAASTSTSGPTAAVGVLSGPHLAAATTRHAAAGAHTASNSSASTQDGSPAAVLGQSKRARPDVKGPGALQAGLTGADEGAAGSGDEELGASDPRVPMEPRGPMEPANGRPAASDSGAAQISPEAEQAATAFLRSFMTQINGEREEGGDRAAAAAAVQEQHGQNADSVTAAATAAAPQLAVQAEAAGGLQPPHNVQELQQQQRQRPPLVQSDPHEEPAAPGQAAELTCSVGLGLQGRPGDEVSSEAGPLAVGAGGGGALARRAAAERTSAAVQRLRRKSSGVAGTDSLHRPAASAGAVGAAAPVASSAGASGSAAAGDAAGAAGAGPRASATAAPPPADCAPGVGASLPTAAGCRRQPERNSGGGASLHHVGLSHQPPAAGPHPQQPSAASAGIVANVESDTPTASAVGMRASGIAGLSPLRPAAAAAFHASGTAVAAEAAAAEGEAHEALGAVSSPAAAPPLSHAEGEPEATGTAELAQGLDSSSQAGAAAHMPAWAHAHAGGRGSAHDRARPGPGLPGGEALPHRSPPLIPPPHDRPCFGVPGLPLSGAAGLAAGRVPNVASLHASTLAPGAVPAGLTAGGAPQTGASQPQPQPPMNAPHPPGPSCMPFRPGAPFGVGPPVGPPHLPFPHPSWGLPPHVLLGGYGPGPFPGAFPPGLQWRPGPPSSVPGVPGQPVVSLVEVEVLARKELLLLKWSMLQEMALELETEWVEACRAHNRLRQLSTVQAQLGGAGALPPLAGELAGSVGPAAPPGGAPLLLEGAQPTAHAHHAHHTVAPLLHPQQQQQVPQQLHLHSQPQPQVFAQLHVHQLTQQDQEQTQQQTQQEQQQQQQQQQQPASAVVPDASLHQATPSQPPAPLQGALRPPIPAVGQGEASAPAVRMEAAAHTAGPPGGQEGTAVERVRAAAPHPGTSNAPGPSNPAVPDWPSGRQPGAEEERRLGHPTQRSEQQLATSQPPQRSGPERRGGDAASGSLPERGSGSGSEQQTRQRDGVSASTARQVSPRPVEQGSTVAPSCQRLPEAAVSAAATGAPGGAAPRQQLTSTPPGASGNPPQGSTAEAPSGSAAAAATTTTTAGATRARALQVNGLSQPESPTAGDHQPAGVRADVPGSASAGTAAGAGGNIGGAKPSSQPGRSAAAGAVGQQVQVAPPADLRDEQLDGRALATRSGGRDGNQAAAASAPTAAERPAETEPPEVVQGREAGASRADAALQLPEPCGGERGGGGPESSGQLGAGPSTGQQQTRAWMPWEDASGAGAGGTGQEAHGNGVATGTGSHGGGDGGGGGGGGGVTSGGLAGAGWGGTGEGDDGRGAGSGEATLFTGLSFKLAAASMVGGRRVAAMRALSGPVPGAGASPAPPPVRAAALSGGPPAKRAQPSVAALVAAPILRTGRRGSSAVSLGPAASAGGAGAAAAVADAAAPSRAAAAAAPAEPPVRVQSAPQVPPATRARGGGPKDAAVAGGPQAQQALPQPVSSSDSGSAGLREIPAAVASPANQTAAHVQAPPATGGTTAATAMEESRLGLPARSASLGQAQSACQVHRGHEQQPPAHHPRQPAAQGSDATLTARQQPPQQQRSAAPAQMASQRALSSPLRYQARGDVLLTTQGGAGAAAPALSSTLQMLGTKYVSPLGIFRSYSGSGPR